MRNKLINSLENVFNFKGVSIRYVDENEIKTVELDRDDVEYRVDIAHINDHMVVDTIIQMLKDDLIELKDVGENKHQSYLKKLLKIEE